MVEESREVRTILDPEDVRETKIAFRVRKDEREIITRAARTAKMPVAVYIRSTMVDSAQRRVARARAGVEL